MRDVEQLDKISKMVAETLRADFDNVRIMEVRVVGDIDFNEEDVLRIEVVFQGQRKDVDVKKISGAVRHVRPKLRKMGEQAFPLFSFISQRDAGLGHLEPA